MFRGWEARKLEDDNNAAHAGEAKGGNSSCL